MSEFGPAITVVLKHEGGYVDNPNDPGGATNWGISLRFLQNQPDGGLEVGDVDEDGDVDADDIRKMTRSDAVYIYRIHWWEKYQYRSFIDQEIANKVLDLSVNMGARQAHRLAQRAARACHRNLVEDGLLGPKSFSALNSLDPRVFLASLRSEQAGFYRLLAATRPKLKTFLKGWLRRAYT